MMQIWIVWSHQPLACFSSEERARQYIASQPHSGQWHCVATELNPESAGVALPAPAPARRSARPVLRLNH
ncbi:hypothetical protein ACFONG_05035 [Uliginosibacterium paludis]|jgi:hypothetical protein|uniref:Uncharacterized protein n=1 Tax=Uliginosibacterium paludis TaxID=1615952 RepID=A0ABV2CSD7_9RHOO